MTEMRVSCAARKMIGSVKAVKSSSADIHHLPSCTYRWGLHPLRVPVHASLAHSCWLADASLTHACMLADASLTHACLQEVERKQDSTAELKHADFLKLSKSGAAAVADWLLGMIGVLSLSWGLERQDEHVT